jgi:hypothetical protein
MEGHGINSAYRNLHHHHKFWLCRRHGDFFLYLLHQCRSQLELLKPSN